MKKTLLVTALIASVCASQVTYAKPVEDESATYERDHTEELVGFGSGALIGAAVGGPVGAIIGAFTGSIIGKSVGDDHELKAQKTLINEQQQEWQTSQNELSKLQKQQHAYAANQQEFYALKAELARIQAQQDETLAELNIGLNVQFKTGSSEIAPIYKEQLDNVAYMMALSPDLSLDLSGFADRRGDEEFNLALSQQRVNTVKTYLEQQGIDASRLHSQAYGASAPLHEAQSFENDFFDRRVTLKLVADNAQLASN